MYETQIRRQRSIAASSRLYNTSFLSAGSNGCHFSTISSDFPLELLRLVLIKKNMSKFIGRQNMLLENMLSPFDKRDWYVPVEYP